ncbi:MAG TPA: NusG domain II-containing protein [Candidatus Limiplasma sp.]|nr:NusG domain II-containing protein [Candidatus Limiplasma sp.]HRX07985.1 NusG domain II-containing protein [Candidatus Limiplasma sp.]
MKRRDIIILVIVLVASLTLYLLRPKAVDDASAGVYMRVSIAGQEQELVPLTEDREIRIEQDNGDYNIIHIFDGGFEITEANCYNQDCIHQGEVTVDNIGGRALANEVICLPHKLVLSLVSADGAEPETAQ